MNEATELLAWGAVIHLVCDWLLQSEWMAVNKTSLRHPAAYVHSGIHALGFLLVFPWYGALALGASHLLIDTRKPVEWWSKLIGQTQPKGGITGWGEREGDRIQTAPYYDLGLEVRIWVDQVFHVAAIALMAVAA